jgi:hypothetical protein
MIQIPDLYHCIDRIAANTYQREPRDNGQVDADRQGAPLAVTRAVGGCACEMVHVALTSSTFCTSSHPGNKFTMHYWRVTFAPLRMHRILLTVNRC